MSKKKFQRYLKEFMQYFTNDSEVLTALNLLKEKVELLPDAEEKVSRELVVPNEINGKMFAFALFSDGACRGNPGPGSWATLAQNPQGEVIFEATGFEMKTTNNRMELEGMIASLKQLQYYLAEKNVESNSHSEIYVYSDSKYAIEGITKWVIGWKNNGWKKADKKEPENLDLWQELDELKAQFSQLNFMWVKGHAGHPQNERCDELCNKALDEAGY